MKILSLSDVQVPSLTAPGMKERLHEVDLIIDCGDLPNDYLEYIHDSLDLPLYYVRGNHSKARLHTEDGSTRVTQEWGTNLHRRIRRHGDLILAGVEGSLRYSSGPFQYTQEDMWFHVWRLVPGLLLNRVRYGRALDIFVTHAPPWGIHDDTDRPHQGVKAFLWLDRLFQPDYHLHGHIHVYHPDTVTTTVLGATSIMNTCGYRITEITIDRSNR